MPPTDYRVVLVVDEDQAIRENICECLELEGYGWWTAVNADDALRRLQSEPRTPNAILLDLKMPGMPVERFIALITQHEAWASIPVILTTAASDHEIPRDLPLRAILPRPFNLTQLLAILRGLLGGGDAVRDSHAP